MNTYYNICRKCIEKSVIIRTRDGRVHRGVIQRVTHSHVYLKPLPTRHLGGYGYGYGLGAFGWGIALGAIAGLALSPGNYY